jgi:hypothetical protein
VQGLKVASDGVGARCGVASRRQGPPPSFLRSLCEAAPTCRWPLTLCIGFRSKGGGSALAVGFSLLPTARSARSGERRKGGCVRCMCGDSGARMSS